LRSNRAEIARQQREVALVDLVDRLLAGGVVIGGDVTLSIADVDLVYVSLRALITSVGAAEDMGFTLPAEGAAGLAKEPRGDAFSNDALSAAPRGSAFGKTPRGSAFDTESRD
jgi:hypothetical protein